MKQGDIISMAYDFLSVLFARIDITKIRTVVLFGSVARNDFDRESDIDIFIDTTNKLDTQIRQVVKVFDGMQKKRWYPKGINLPLKVMCGNLDEHATLKEEIQEYGIVLYGSYVRQVTKDYFLVSYNLKKISRASKMKLLRTFYGYSTKKEGVTYIQSGLLKEAHGLRIGTNVFIIPITAKKKVEETLKTLKVLYQIRKIGF
ncbi:nucleotidyltransferase domain-containing protein [Candidatus Woesearchaeota archaeon]|nr:nucleotidyltransferase domain-containing protein [Candidatus Woesearchaeota archaeon]